MYLIFHFAAFAPVKPIARNEKPSRVMRYSGYSLPLLSSKVDGAKLYREKLSEHSRAQISAPREVSTR